MNKEMLTRDEKTTIAFEIEQYPIYHLQDCEIHNENTITENELGSFCTCGLTESMVNEFESLLSKKMEGTVETEKGEAELSQGLIDAYEDYVWNVKKAIRFVEMGSGGSRELAILKEIIEQHEKEMWEDIENLFDKLN